MCSPFYPMTLPRMRELSSQGRQWERDLRKDLKLVNEIRTTSLNFEQSEVEEPSQEVDRGYNYI